MPSDDRDASAPSSGDQQGHDEEAELGSSRADEPAVPPVDQGEGPDHRGDAAGEAGAATPEWARADGAAGELTGPQFVLPELLELTEEPDEARATRRSEPTAADGRVRRGREEPGSNERPSRHTGGRDERAPQPKKRRRSGKQRAVLLAGITSVFAIVLVASGLVYVTNKLGAIERTNVPVDVATDNSPINILVVGSDSRENVAKNDPDAGAFIAGVSGDTGRRSDTIMVVRVNPKTEIIDILSLPRDLWLPLAGETENSRLNSAYSESPEKLIQTIKQFFGIDINHYVEVDFKGFKGIVDAVGGVPMYFDKPMRDGNSGLRIDKAGCQTLDGEQALAFARSRHLQYKDDKAGWKDDPTGDIGRIDRQQFFLRQIFDVTRVKALSPDLRVTNDLLNTVVANVKVDKSMDVGRMADLSRRFADKTSDQLVSWSLPVTQYNTAGGASVVRMAADDATPILDVFRGLTPDAWPTWAIKMTVVGAPGVLGQGAEAQKALQEIGFVVAGSADGKTPQKRTTIKYPVGYHRMAVEVARRLAAGADVVEDKNISDFTLVVTLGSDYTGTTAEPRPLEEAADGSSPSTIAAAVGPKPSSTIKASSSSASSTTTSTEYVLGGKSLVGVVPGKPPDGVTCGK